MLKQGCLGRQGCQTAAGSLYRSFTPAALTAAHPGEIPVRVRPIKRALGYDLTDAERGLNGTQELLPEDSMDDAELERLAFLVYKKAMTLIGSILPERGISHGIL